CGKACPGYEIRIFDRDDASRELPAREIGQIGGRGASLMLGYFDDQKATEEAFNRDGWFMTGDLGRVGEGGHLRLPGRSQEAGTISTRRRSKRWPRSTTPSRASPR